MRTVAGALLFTSAVHRLHREAVNAALVIDVSGLSPGRRDPGFRRAGGRGSRHRQGALLRLPGSLADRVPHRPPRGVVPRRAGRARSHYNGGMRSPASRWIVGMALGGAALLWAQEWQTVASLAGVDLTGLTPARKTRALNALRTQACSCGCGMKVAECRVKDPSCSFSRGLASVTVGAIKAGKTETAAIAESKASKFGSRPAPQLLDDPVPIPTLGSPVTGPANARITLVEFSDFQCPYCSKAVAQITATLKAYPNAVRLIFKQYPLDFHPQATISAAASLAAHQQGKFWPMHDVMFANRPKLSRQSILAWAMAIGLDMKRFTADLDSAPIGKTVLRDQADGDKAGVEGTPTVFLNGQRYNGDLAPDAIKPVIDGELKRLAALKK